MRTTACTAAFAVMTLALVGCGDPASQTAPILDVLPPSAAHAGKAVVEGVSGGGNYFAPDRRTFGFSALRHADGTVRGQWERIRRQDGNAADSKSHGVITCFTRVGNEVWFGGYATSGTFSEPPFNEVAWRAAAPNQLSLQFVGGGPGFAASYCDGTPPSPALIDLVSGTITFR